MKKHHLTHRPPRAITLIELLVVVAILSLLSIFVLPAINGNRENTANRNAAQQVSSLISQSRNDAIAVGRPGGITVLENELDIARCRVPPPYRGDTSPTRLVFSSLGSALSVAAGSVANITNAGVSDGDRVRFEGGGPTYSVASVVSPSFTISLLTAAATTPLPPAGVAIDFEIARKPRVIGTLVSLANESSIDMAWSGYGGLGGYTRFSAGNQVSIVFDETGVLTELVVGGTRIVPDGSVFLLVGRVDRRGSSYNASAGPSASDDTIGANWQYPTSYWVGIDPASGQARIAECVPGCANDLDSQEWVRAALVTQGL